MLPRPSAPSVGSVRPRHRLRHMQERVGAGVPVVGGVGQLACTAGVDNDHEGAALHGWKRAVLVRARMRAEVHVAQSLGREMRVELRGGDIGVSEHLLERTQVAAPGQQVRRKGVAKGVRTHPVCEPPTAPAYPWTIL